MELMPLVLDFIVPGKQMRVRSSHSLALMKTSHNLSPMSVNLKAYLFRRSLF